MPKSASAALAVVETPFDIAASRTRLRVPLRDLDIAPENLRFGEPPDDDIPLLAETLFAAGQLEPLTVRPGRRKEQAHMALDGRRRLLALRHLLEGGRIDDGFLVDVVVETDPARQAAAVLLTNTAAPVHVADVIAAIGRMLKSRLAVPGIAKALGYAEIDVKRLAALSALPQAALDALRRGRLNLRQARLLARLPDKAEQAEYAQMALDGHGFQDWRITEKLDEDQVTAGDARCVLVGAERYAAAGGRTVVDLFGERAPMLLDPAILTDVWTSRAREVALVFEAEGLAVHVSASADLELPDDLEPARYAYGGMLPTAELDAYRAAREVFNAAGEAVGDRLAETTDPAVVDPLLIAMARARLAMDQISWGGRVATSLVFFPSPRAGLDVRCFTPVEPELEESEDSRDARDGTDDAQDLSPANGEPYRAPEVEAPEPETEGITHALHAVRTDVATRGLIRALADDPGAALTALIARLFVQVAVRRFGVRSESAFALTATAFNPTGGRIIEPLDGDVRRRLDERRAAWEGSDQTVIAWVHALAHGDKMSLLAELTALTLDLREERTSLIRRSARAEAAELAALCGADITLHWTPDADFLKPHSKMLLLGMLDAMGEPSDPRVGGLKKTELVDWIAERAADRAWAPAGLSWTVDPPDDDPDAAVMDGRDPSDAAAEETASAEEDGAGAFVVTEAGEAALQQTA
ncbi:ParB/RepB/Spo0J family partition protein [Brevundimonas sp.]|uniref:ParB/RepB/Spo0J family partition protein n=1 Tax=Brevundimonas sp. TaxID=1871086 RepID=UPI003F70FFE5